MSKKFVVKYLNKIDCWKSDFIYDVISGNLTLAEWESYIPNRKLHVTEDEYLIENGINVFEAGYVRLLNAKTLIEHIDSIEDAYKYMDILDITLLLEKMEFNTCYESPPSNAKNVKDGM